MPARWSDGRRLYDNEPVRTALRLAAWGLALLAVALIAGGLVLDRIAAGQDVEEVGNVWLYPWLLGAVAAPAAVGALIAARRPRNAIGWVLVAGALSLGVVLAATPYAWVALEAHPGSLPGGSWAALVSSLWPVFFAWPLAIAFVFPDGRLPSRRWRPFALFAAGSMALLMFVLVVAEQLEAPFSDAPNPVPLRLPDTLGLVRPVAWLAVFASLVVGAAAVRIRYRRSAGIERLQLLWLAYAALLIPLGVVVFLALGESGDAVVGFLLGMEAAVAIAVGVAVMRYRLYEIDRLLNRTLVYAFLTAALGLVYASVSLLAGVALGLARPGRRLSPCSSSRSRSGGCGVECRPRSIGASIAPATRLCGACVRSSRTSARGGASQRTSARRSPRPCVTEALSCSSGYPRATPMPTVSARWLSRAPTIAL